MNTHTNGLGQQVPTTSITRAKRLGIIIVSIPLVTPGIVSAVAVLFIIIILAIFGNELCRNILDSVMKAMVPRRVKMTPQTA